VAERPPIGTGSSHQRCADRMLSPAVLYAKLGLAEATAWDAAR